MALNEKQKKKLSRWIGGAEQKFNIVFIDLCIQYFILFCITLFFDKIAQALEWRYDEGFGAGQMIISAVCVFQMWRYARRIKK